MHTSVRVVSTFVGLLALACNCLGTERTRAARAAITHGVLASEFPAVVALRDRTALCPIEPKPPFCSGQLVGPRAVITTAHCVLGYQPWTVEAVLGDDARDGGQALAVEAIRIHPDYDVATRAHDLAMLILRTPVSVAPFEVVPYLEDSGIVDAERIQLIGFGADVVSGVPGLKRAGMAAVEEVTPSLLRVRGAPSLSCDGDSGGAAIAVTDARTSATLGVIRSGDSGCSEFTMIVRLTPYWEGFIQPILAEAQLSPQPVEAAVTCEEPCTTNASCQGGAVCLDTERGKRCGYPKLGSVEYRSPCASGADCISSLCVSVATDSGSDVCRCATPCSDPLEGRTPERGEESAEAGSGCAMAQRAPSLSIVSNLFGAALFLLVRRRAKSARFATSSHAARRRAQSRAECAPHVPLRPSSAGSRARLGSSSIFSWRAFPTKRRAPTWSAWSLPRALPLPRRR